jgi:DNA-binding IclR family transcriptional regulator
MTRERQILKTLAEAGGPMSSADIAECIGAGRDKTRKVCGLLFAEGVIAKVGTGRDVAWRVIQGEAAA